MSTSCPQLRMLTSTLTLSSNTRKGSILQRHSRPTTQTLSRSMMTDMVNSSLTTIHGENSLMGLTVPDEHPFPTDHALTKSWVLTRKGTALNSFLFTQRVMKQLNFTGRSLCAPTKRNSTYLATLTHHTQACSISNSRDVRIDLIARPKMSSEHS